MSVATLPWPVAGRRPAESVAYGLAATDQANVALLRAGAGAVARALDAHPGDEVIVLCRDRFRFAAALLGVWRAGRAVALPPNAQPETVRELRHRPGVATVLHDGAGEKGIDVRTLPHRAAPDDDRPIPADRHVVTLYTSGSTGDHRAVPKTAAQLLGEVETLIAAFPDVAGARVLTVPPPHHVYGLLFGVLLPLRAGGAFFRQAPGDGGTLADELRRTGTDVLVSVPARLRTAAALDGAALPGLRRVFSSGAPLPDETARDLHRAAGWRVTEVLGSTETGGIGWRERADGEAPPWAPFPGVRVTAADDGRLRVDSPLLDPDAQRPHEGADRVRVHPDGRFEHLGRADGVLKIGAVRVSVAEVERRLLAVDGVRDAAVLPVQVGGPRGWETWAAVVAPGHDARTLRAALRRWLVPVALPRRFRFVDALPRGDAGKLRRADLRALFESTGARRRPAPASPGTPTGADADQPRGREP